MECFALWRLACELHVDKPKCSCKVKVIGCSYYETSGISSDSAVMLQSMFRVSYFPLAVVGLCIFCFTNPLLPPATHLIRWWMNKRYHLLKILQSSIQLSTLTP